MLDLPAIRDQVLDHMGRVYDALSEFFTGIAVSDRKDWALSIGYVLQRQRGKEFLKSLMYEWEKYRKKGKIKEDYAATEQCQASLQEILNCLNEDSPDEIKFTFLKKLFMAMATEELLNRESILPIQYIRIARSLSSGEILVLLGAYRIAKSQAHAPGRANTHQTLIEIAKESGLVHTDLVRVLQRGLIDKGLFISMYGDEAAGNTHIGEYYRLTDLGFELCKYVEHYDSETERLGEG